MTSVSCANKIQEQLIHKGIPKSDINISYETGIVTVNTNQPSSLILNSIEQTGIKAVLKGYGSATRMAIIATLNSAQITFCTLIV